MPFEHAKGHLLYYIHDGMTLRQSSNVLERTRLKVSGVICK